jgi:hypothetical protein
VPGPPGGKSFADQVAQRAYETGVTGMSATTFFVEGLVGELAPAAIGAVRGAVAVREAAAAARAAEMSDLRAIAQQTEGAFLNNARGTCGAAAANNALRAQELGLQSGVVVIEEVSPSVQAGVASRKHAIAWVELSDGSRAWMTYGDAFHDLNSAMRDVPFKQWRVYGMYTGKAVTATVVEHGGAFPFSVE